MLKPSRSRPQQVEDTLNNSNELFLTFRKEMEEMSKKTKRLEKENLTLTRKHDQTNRNILEMAEERTRDKEDLERLRKQETQMRNIIKSMQEQGRGLPPGTIDEEGTESEYDEEYEDEEDDEYDEDEEEYEVDPVELERAMTLEAEAELARGEAMRQELSKGKEVDGKPVFGPAPPPGLRAKYGHQAQSSGSGGGGGPTPLMNGSRH